MPRLVGRPISRLVGPVVPADHCHLPQPRPNRNLTTLALPFIHEGDHHPDLDLGSVLAAFTARPGFLNPATAVPATPVARARDVERLVSLHPAHATPIRHLPSPLVSLNTDHVCSQLRRGLCRAPRELPLLRLFPPAPALARTGKVSCTMLPPPPGSLLHVRCGTFSIHTWLAPSSRIPSLCLPSSFPLEAI